MSENSQEKTLQPSEKKKRDLRKKGTFLRSKEWSSGSILITSLFILMWIIPKITDDIAENLNDTFMAIPWILFSGENISILYEKMAIKSILILAPLCIPLFLISIFGVFLFGGFGFSLTLLKPKMERLNVLKNLKRIVSPQNVYDVFKSILKMSVFVAAMLVFLNFKFNELARLGSLNETESILRSLNLIKVYLFMISGGILVIMLIDMLYSYFKHNKSIKMSHSDVKDENRQTEGSPEIKNRVRSAQIAMARKRIRKNIPKATVVITNPSHYAVALKYVDGVDKAPEVLAKGKDNIAAEIRLLAIKHGIPIYQAPPLSRALYYTTDVGQTIHEELYYAVAMVLSYIHQLKLYQQGQGNMPALVDDLSIPDHLNFDDRV